MLGSIPGSMKDRASLRVKPRRSGTDPNEIAVQTPELVAVLGLRDLQETSNQHLRPFGRSRRVEQLLSALPHLLPPHRAIETFARE